MVHMYNQSNIEKILEIFFNNPGKSFHIRQLARLTKLSPNTIINLTEKITKEGYITKTKSEEANLTVIKANRENRLYKLKKQAYNIEKIHHSGLIEYLNNKLAFPTIILFGSYAKGENHEKSDIDLFIITEEKKKLDLKDYEKKLNTEIQLFIHTKKELKRLKSKNPELLNNVINGYKLSGFLEVL